MHEKAKQSRLPSLSYVVNGKLNVKEDKVHILNKRNSGVRGKVFTTVAPFYLSLARGLRNSPGCEAAEASPIPPPFSRMHFGSVVRGL